MKTTDAEGKQQCLMCRDTGLVVWADESSTTSCYCDCLVGQALWHADQDDHVGTEPEGE